VAALRTGYATMRSSMTSRPAELNQALGEAVIEVRVWKKALRGQHGVADRDIRNFAEQEILPTCLTRDEGTDRQGVVAVYPRGAVCFGPSTTTSLISHQAAAGRGRGW
jgi:hypothetical protein